MRTKIDKRTSAPFPLRKRSRKREQAVTFWENKSLFDDLNIEVIFLRNLHYCLCRQLQETFKKWNWPKVCIAQISTNPCTIFQSTEQTRWHSIQKAVPFLELQFDDTMSKEESKCFMFLLLLLAPSTSALVQKHFKKVLVDPLSWNQQIYAVSVRYLKNCSFTVSCSQKHDFQYFAQIRHGVHFYVFRQRRLLLGHLWWRILLWNDPFCSPGKGPRTKVTSLLGFGILQCPEGSAQRGLHLERRLQGLIFPWWEHILPCWPSAGQTFAKRCWQNSLMFTKFTCGKVIVTKHGGN